MRWLRRQGTVFSPEEDGGATVADTTSSWKQFVPSERAEKRVVRATWAATVLLVAYVVVWSILNNGVSAEMPANLSFCVVRIVPAANALCPKRRRGATPQRPRVPRGRCSPPLGLLFAYRRSNEVVPVLRL